MSTRAWDERITTRYTEPKRDIYEQIMALVKENGVPKSTAQLLLVERGLKHVSNPEPLIKTVVKEVPVEKIKTVIKEVPVEVIKEVPVYKSPPKVDKSTPHIERHITIEEPITDDHIRGDTEFEQRPSADIRTTQDKAVSPRDTALDVKKSAKADSDGKKDKGIGGWIALGGFLTLIFGPLVYSWLTPKQTEPVNQIGKPNEFTEQVDQNRMSLPRSNPYNPYI